MDAARGPPTSLGATPSPEHDTLPAAAPAQVGPRAPRSPAALAGSGASGNLRTEDSPSGLWRTIGNRVGC
jgi:hypothetical protein